LSSEFIRTVADWSERRLLRTFQNLVRNKTSCGIFFAPVPDNARQIVNSFKGVGINLDCICVLSNEDKTFFQPLEGENLIALEQFPSLLHKPKYILVLERYFGTAFIDYFGRHGTNIFFMPSVDDAEAQYEFYMKHLPELYEVHEMLADDESKRIFRAAITGRITRLMQDFIYTDEHEYFLNGFFPKKGDIAIEGGPFDGETSVDFVKQGAKVYAFEMDAANYKNCLAPAKKFGFTIENLGLSNQEKEAIYSVRGVGSRKLTDKAAKPGSGESIARFIDIDTYVDRKNLPHVDYIKLDIEGSELETLRGATKTITRWKPKMAICVYHKPEDLFTLPLYIKHLRSDYEFQFRHHLCDRKKEIHDNIWLWGALKYFDVSYRTPSEYDMILYCK